jgi:hypothetical protein
MSVTDTEVPVAMKVFRVTELEPRKFSVQLPDAFAVKYWTAWVITS